MRKRIAALEDRITDLWCEHQATLGGSPEEAEKAREIKALEEKLAALRARRA